MLKLCTVLAACYVLAAVILMGDTLRPLVQSIYEISSVGIGRDIGTFNLFQKIIGDIPMALSKDAAALLKSGKRSETIARACELLCLAPPVVEEAAESDPLAAQALAYPCPCCGGRMIVIETFEAGCQPRRWPTAPLVEIRIDTS